MVDASLSALLVVDKGKVVGTITDRGAPLVAGACVWLLLSPSLSPAEELSRGVLLAPFAFVESHGAAQQQFRSRHS